MKPISPFKDFAPLVFFCRRSLNKVYPCFKLGQKNSQKCGKTEFFFPERRRQAFDRARARLPPPAAGPGAGLGGERPGGEDGTALRRGGVGRLVRGDAAGEKLPDDVSFLMFSVSSYFALVAPVFAFILYPGTGSRGQPEGQGFGGELPALPSRTRVRRRNYLSGRFSGRRAGRVSRN